TLRAQVPQVLRVEEVMGFDTRRTSHLQHPLLDQPVQPEGATLLERARSLFTQLRYHGIPGGVIGEPRELLPAFIAVCEQLLRDNRQASILWVVSSHKKGSVTRAIHNSNVSSHVTVASLVTLRDAPALISHPWTLIIFQNLDQLLDGSPLSWALFHLKWQWM